MTKTPRFPENHKRVAVIIGASSGIGKTLASELSREGWRLALAARRLDLLERIAASCGPDTLIRRVDLAESEKAAAAIQSLLDELGTVDLFIISAGTGHMNPELEWSPDRDTLLVNVMGFVSLAQAAMRPFFAAKAWASGGNFVNRRSARFRRRRFLCCFESLPVHLPRWAPRSCQTAQASHNNNRSTTRLC